MGLSIPSDSCYELVTTGRCPVLSTCPYNHKIGTRICVACKEPKSFPDRYFADHLLTEHTNDSANKGIPVVEDGNRWCPICQCPFAGTSKTALRAHYEEVEHKDKSSAASLRLQSLAVDAYKHMFKIQGNPNFGAVQPGLEVVRSFFTKTPAMGTFSVGRVTLECRDPELDTAPFKLLTQLSRWSVATRAKPLEIRVSFQNDIAGLHQCNLQVTYQCQETQESFPVVTTLVAVVQDPEADQTSDSPATPPVTTDRPTMRQGGRHGLGGAKPPPSTAIRYKQRLPQAHIPPDLASAISKGSMKEVLEHVRKSYFPAKLGVKTYSEYFKILLWIEEAKASQDILLYDIKGVNLVPHEDNYWLEIPGSAEKRPRVLLGGHILIRRQIDNEDDWYEGRVWDVQHPKVNLRLSLNAPKITAEDLCDVRFKLDRSLLQRQYQALDIPLIPERIVFPKTRFNSTQVSRPPLTSFVNPLIGDDSEQREAVESILSRPPGSVPFVILGAPCTGKTGTLVEAMYQILSRDTDSRILICAPNSTTADDIARRLIGLHLKTYTLFRLYSPKHPKEDVDDDILPFTFTHRSGALSVPPLDQLMAFRVIVTTCLSASILTDVGVPSGHFSYIFIDDASQATEPEVMVPIRTMLGNETNVILSGDPKQLGPVIRSGVARELGFGKSYLERLIKFPIYYEKEDSTNQNIIKLLRNYRSHPAILEVSNQQFYQGDLEPCGDPEIINTFVNSPILPQTGSRFPIVFTATVGKNEQDPASSSFFNMEEVFAVKKYVRQLKDLGIADEDIGIITPYRAQCQKIRTALEGSAETVKIGFAEEFQGDERLVIIISTVRSNADLLEYDFRFNLGLVMNPRRFNVAVTRAKALLLVTGDPRVLSIDQLWCTLMKYVHNNGGWKGVTLDRNTMAIFGENDSKPAKRHRKSSQKKVAEITAHLESLNVEDDPAGMDRPAFVELE